ncbi:MAG: glycoside hydrolase family 2 protein, partial [Anaerolineae bacterium]|nr:glycoside hydrolase family 2 protein [Anaerolineae bacterium]
MHFSAALLNDFAPGDGLAANAHLPNFDDSAWIPVDVPGDVHQALIAAGRIEDPFYDQNEDKCAWMEDREWWYRLTFDAPAEPLTGGERFRLVFHGLDTFVTIWLNGEEIGSHKNMFRAATFDVSNLITPGQTNTLALCFDRPFDHIEEFGTFQTWGRNEERVFMRKAQFGYGWDWGPRLPTIGIWRPVELRREWLATITGTHFYTLEIKPNQALVAVKVEAERFAGDAPLIADIQLTPPDGSAPITAHLPLTANAGQLTGTAYLAVQNPALWWTHDLGDPALYDLQVALCVENGAELAMHTQQVGIRTIELDQSPDPDEWGTRFFRFVLNGVPIFAKGADWIPADSFVGAITDDHYTMLLTAARDVNMNMLRIWGGGLYEHDIFYELCDQLGILIWQDFMFACAMYPEHHQPFVDEVAAEAEYQVRRLRSHPCIALWNGCNENQWINNQVFWQATNVNVSGALYYNHILPDAVAAWDGQIPYWPGSPYGGNDHNSMLEGNRHNWNVWHGQDYGRKFGEEPGGGTEPENVNYWRYAEDMGRFISEFGMHAAPVFETLRRNIPADQLYHHSPSMDHHNKDNPKNKGDNLMIPVTGLPDTLDEYVDFSMIAQAEGLKFGIEHFRRRKPHCSGTLYWQFNDCWPVLSWATMDYYGFGKAGYFYTRRFYAPVLASFKALEDGSVELWLTNDTLEPITDEVTIKLAGFAGTVYWTKTAPITVGANASAAVWSIPADDLEAGPDRYLYASSKSDVFAPNREFFAA